MPDDAAVLIDGRTVAVTSLDRVLFPRVGFTKRELVAYYLRAAPLIIPWLRGRPATLRRFPSGLEGPSFFQTRAPSHPDWVTATELHFESTGKTFDAVVIGDAASLLWAANLSTIEFHPFLGCVGSLDRPTVLVFDLDPGDGVGLDECCTVACALRSHLDLLGLPSTVKTSGGFGLHVVVPLRGVDTYTETKAFARALAALLRRELPELVVDVMTRSLRAGKVFIDWGQNDPGKSTVAPYSLRAVFDVPTVAMPVSWTDVEAHTVEVLDVGRAVERLEQSRDLLSVGDGVALPKFAF